MHVRFAHLRCGSPSGAQCAFWPRHGFFLFDRPALLGCFQATSMGIFFKQKHILASSLPFSGGILIETMCLLSREGGGASWRVSRQTLIPAHALVKPSHRDQRDDYILLLAVMRIGRPTSHKYFLAYRAAQTRGATFDPESRK